MRRNTLIGLTVAALVVSAIAFVVAQDVAKPTPEKAAQLLKAGNWKEAFAEYSKLTLDKDADPAKVVEYFNNAIQCQNNLGNEGDIDGFREEAIKAQASNWRLLQAAANSYQNGNHNGYIVAGTFNRGWARHGRVKNVNAYQRDRIRALQLMQQAMEATAKDNDHNAVGRFHLDFANMLMGYSGGANAWRLQDLSDLTTLPDYDEGYYYGGYGGGRGAPVDADGKPIFHYQPKSWKDAKTDGERWRFELAQAMELSPKLLGEVKLIFASFLHDQFGVQTLADYGWFFSRQESDDDTQKNESGTWAMHTLGEGETIARLANGIKRFKLPDEFNFIKILKEIADNRSFDHRPRELLANIFENRRQYPKAVEQWQLAIKEFGAGDNGYRQKALDQIVGNWGLFENIMTQPTSEKGATVDFRFRNATKLNLTAQAIDVAKLLADVKAYLKSNSGQLEWDRMELNNIGYRLVEKNEKQYLTGEPEKWDLDLKPRANHVDSRITVQTPLKKAGAYLLTGTLDNGNVSRIVVWVADTVIVKKPLDKGTLVYVADAVTGQPTAKANVEFFGYYQEWTGGNNGKYVVHTKDFAEFTDADGMIVTTGDDGEDAAPAAPAAAPAPKDKDAEKQQAKARRRLSSRYQWVITATTVGGDPKEGGRLAYLGFTGIWSNNYHDAEYNQTKVFTITDRPVYRPGGPVKFKFWVNTAKYDQEGKSEYAGKTFLVQVNDPKNEKVYENKFTADEFGGFDGEIPADKLGKDATLGTYQLFLPGDKNTDLAGHALSGGGNFRLEEYKKPEFEVKVDAPDAPVMLGEKVSAKVTAKYYFGGAVTEGKAKYRVMRTSYSANWYPVAYWDWFYNPGYWWFACDYAWYPGWNEWGCRRPTPIWWWRWHPQEQPELVAEAEAPLGKDGTFTIDIDTSLAKAVHASQDHKYEITVEVTDPSRRTIVGTGSVLVARKPFKVYAWVDRGHFRAGDVVQSHLCAQTLAGKPVKGEGELTLRKISYDAAKGNEPVEKVVEEWKLPTNDEGHADQQMKAGEPGQYRISYKLTDAAKHTIEGGYVFTVTGDVADAKGYRFNDIELVSDKKEYKPDDKVDLLVNTDQADSTVLLFVRASNGVYLAPKVLRLKGKSVHEAVAVVQKDMPNFFIEGLTVSKGHVFTEVREIVVPPVSRVLDVKVIPTAATTKPGEKVKVTIKLTDPNGEPYAGSTVVAMYDKAVEYISGGSNVPAIKEFYWKWRRQHYPQTESSVDRGSGNLLKSHEIGMSFLGVFGASVVEELADERDGKPNAAAKQQDGQGAPGSAGGRGGGFGNGNAEYLRADRAALGAAPAAPMSQAMAAKGEASDALENEKKDKNGDLARKEAGGEAGPEPVARTNFADTAFWAAVVSTDAKGEATVEIKMPENLTTWKTRVWAMGQGTKVGEGTTEVITTKDVIVRLQAPRFFVQKDEVVLSANVHNFLKVKKEFQVTLELKGNTLKMIEGYSGTAAGDIDFIRTCLVDIDAGGEKRVDWVVNAVQPGNAVVTMKAVCDSDSDAMKMEFPVFVHGMLKMDSYCGVIRPNKDSGTVTVKVPAERLPEQSVLEVRYSPTLAGAMVDALPYMVDYPYGCTEQTLNRFLPTVITQKVLLKMGLNLKDIEKKRTNLNAQEIGDDAMRAKDWSYRGGYMSRGTAEVKNPVFDEDEVARMVKANLARLTAMQCSDGGWGWFSGFGEHSWPHTTALVVHGLQIARANDVALVPGVLDRGIDWLKNYQAEQVRWIQNFPAKAHPCKEKADALDAFVYMVLADEQAAGKKDLENKDMKAFLYRDKNDLPVYAKAMFGLALHKLGDAEKRDELIRNCDQYWVADDENQTGYLKLPENNWWWCWYGSENEAEAYYLKLLSAKLLQLGLPDNADQDVKREAEKTALGEKASRLVKYLINNRKHASYWNSTRDTAVVVEAFADYIKASGEDKPDMTVTVSLDGKQVKQVKIDGSNLFSFDNKLVLAGKDVTSGEHKIELTRKGTGPVYFNAYLTNFTLEDPIIKSTSVEVKVDRKFYKLVEVDKKIKASGDRGQVLDQKVLKYDRQELKNGDTLTSGDLIEIELTIDSKNDYEYLMFEDMKAAGFEPVEVRSGYNGNDLGAYMELRDERVSFFVRELPRGQRSVSYRLRAEIPGKFSALPAKASAMYAPELKANSDEFKIGIKD